MEKLAALNFNLRYTLNKLEMIQNRLIGNKNFFRDESMKFEFDKKLDNASSIAELIVKFAEEAEEITIRGKIKLATKNENLLKTRKREIRSENLINSNSSL